MAIAFWNRTGLFGKSPRQMEGHLERDSSSLQRKLIAKPIKTTYPAKTHRLQMDHFLAKSDIYHSEKHPVIVRPRVVQTVIIGKHIRGVDLVPLPDEV